MSGAERTKKEKPASAKLLEPDYAEEWVVGAILLDESRYWAVSETLKAAHFASETWKVAYEQIEALAGKVPLNVETLSRHMPADETGDALPQLIVATQKVGDRGEDIDAYAGQIIDAAQRRQLLAEAERLARRAKAQHAVIEDEIAEGARTLADISRVSHSGIVRFDVVVEREKERVARAFEDQRPLGFSTGIATVDNLIGSIQDDDFILLGGSSGGGKTALAMQIAMHVSRTRWVDFVCIDQGSAAIVQRVLAHWSGASTHQVRQADLDMVAMQRMLDGAVTAREHKIRFVSKRHVEDIIHHATAHQRGDGLGLIIIDHLKRLRRRKSHSNSFERIEDCVNKLEELRHDLGVPILLLAQLTRESQSRENPTPQARDLYGGGVVDEAADVVLMCWQPARNEAWCEAMRRRADRDGNDDRNVYIRAREGQANLVLAKHRSREVPCRAWMRFDGPHQRFEELE